MNNEANINYRIRVCIDRSSSDPLTTDGSSVVFLGVVRRKRTSSFYIGNIDLKSTKSDIFHYIESKSDKTFFKFAMFYFLLSHYTYNILEIY